MKTLEYVFGGILAAAILYQVLNASQTTRIIQSLAEGTSTLTKALMGKS